MVPKTPYIKGLMSSLCALLFSVTAQAQTLEHTVTTETELIIKGFHGQVEIQPQTKTKTLSLRSNSFFQTTPTSHSIKVQFSDPPLSSFKEKRGVKLKVTYPSEVLDLKVYWYKGDLKITNPKKKVFVQLQEGSLEIKENQSEVKIYTREASVKIKNSQAPVTMKSYKNSVVVEGAKKPLNIDQFTGLVQIKNSTGKLHLKGEKNKVRFRNVSGSITFHITEADVRGEALSGSVKAKAHTGQILLEFQENPRAHIITQKASVDLKVKDFNGRVYLFSKEGSIKAPSGLPTKKVLYTEVKGFLKGTQNGKIYVRTQKGPISLQNR